MGASPRTERIPSPPAGAKASRPIPEIVEIGRTEDLFAAPRHPYTQGLLDAAPDLDPARRSRVASVRGELPSPLALPPGCHFHPRCRFAFERCSAEHPELTARSPTHCAACHLTEFGCLDQATVLSM